MAGDIDAYWQKILKKNPKAIDSSQMTISLKGFQDSMRNAYLAGFEDGKKTKPPQGIFGSIFGGD